MPPAAARRARADSRGNNAETIQQEISREVEHLLRLIFSLVLGDGAEWIWNQANLHFPDATQIVDLYHAREHLWSLGAKLYPNDSPAQKRWVMVRKRLADLENTELLLPAWLPEVDLVEPVQAGQEANQSRSVIPTKKRTRSPADISSGKLNSS